MAKEPFTARLTCIWMGAGFFWVLKGFGGRYSAMLAEEYKSRNFWVGYGITLVLLMLCVLLLF